MPNSNLSSEEYLASSHEEDSSAESRFSSSSEGSAQAEPARKKRKTSKRTSKSKRARPQAEGAEPARTRKAPKGGAKEKKAGSAVVVYDDNNNVIGDAPPPPSKLTENALYALKNGKWKARPKAGDITQPLYPHMSGQYVYYKEGPAINDPIAAISHKSFLEKNISFPSEKDVTELKAIAFSNLDPRSLNVVGWFSVIDNKNNDIGSAPLPPEINETNHVWALQDGVWKPRLGRENFKGALVPYLSGGYVYYKDSKGALAALSSEKTLENMLPGVDLDNLPAVSFTYVATGILHTAKAWSRIFDDDGNEIGIAPNIPKKGIGENGIHGIKDGYWQGGLNTDDLHAPLHPFVSGEFVYYKEGREKSDPIVAVSAKDVLERGVSEFWFEEDDVKNIWGVSLKVIAGQVWGGCSWKIIRDRQGNEVGLAPSFPKKYSGKGVEVLTADGWKVGNQTIDLRPPLYPFLSGDFVYFKNSRALSDPILAATGEDTYTDAKKSMEITDGTPISFSISGQGKITKFLEWKSILDRDGNEIGCVPPIPNNYKREGVQVSTANAWKGGKDAVYPKPPLYPFTTDDMVYFKKSNALGDRIVAATDKNEYTSALEGMDNIDGVPIDFSINARGEMTKVWEWPEPSTRSHDSESEAQNPNHDSESEAQIPTGEKWEAIVDDNKNRIGYAPKPPKSLKKEGTRTVFGLQAGEWKGMLGTAKFSVPLYQFTVGEYVYYKKGKKISDPIEAISRKDALQDLLPGVNLENVPAMTFVNVRAGGLRTVHAWSDVKDLKGRVIGCAPPLSSRLGDITIQMLVNGVWKAGKSTKTADIPKPVYAYLSGSDVYYKKDNDDESPIIAVSKKSALEGAVKNDIDWNNEVVISFSSINSGKIKKAQLWSSVCDNYGNEIGFVPDVPDELGNNAVRVLINGEWKAGKDVSTNHFEAPLYPFVSGDNIFYKYGEKRNDPIVAVTRREHVEQLLRKHDPSLDVNDLPPITLTNVRTATIVALQPWSSIRDDRDNAIGISPPEPERVEEEAIYLLKKGKWTTVKSDDSFGAPLYVFFSKERAYYKESLAPDAPIMAKSRKSALSKHLAEADVNSLQALTLVISDARIRSVHKWSPALDNDGSEIGYVPETPGLLKKGEVDVFRNGSWMQGEKKDFPAPLYAFFSDNVNAAVRRSDGEEAPSVREFFEFLDESFPEVFNVVPVVTVVALENSRQGHCRIRPLRGGEGIEYNLEKGKAISSFLTEQLGVVYYKAGPRPEDVLLGRSSNETLQYILDGQSIEQAQPISFSDIEEGKPLEARVWSLIHDDLNREIGYAPDVWFALNDDDVLLLADGEWKAGLEVGDFPSPLNVFPSGEFVYYKVGRNPSDPIAALSPRAALEQILPFFEREDEPAIAFTKVRAGKLHGASIVADASISPQEERSGVRTAALGAAVRLMDATQSDDPGSSSAIGIPVARLLDEAAVDSGVGMPGDDDPVLRRIDPQLRYLGSASGAGVVTSTARRDAVTEDDSGLLMYEDDVIAPMTGFDALLTGGISGRQATRPQEHEGLGGESSRGTRQRIETPEDEGDSQDDLHSAPVAKRSRAALAGGSALQPGLAPRDDVRQAAGDALVAQTQRTTGKRKGARGQRRSRQK